MLVVFSNVLLGNLAGKASAIILLSRTVVGTALSQVTTDVTDAYGIAGYYATISLISTCSQFAWFCFKDPPKEENKDLPEELRASLLSPNLPDDTTVASSDVGTSSVHPAEEP